MTWRDKARPIIGKIIRETGTSDMKLLRRKLREAYPFGPRENHPYKIWCDEIRTQLGVKEADHKFERQLRAADRDEKLDAAGQGRLFE